ncbi:MAG TPA: hypothetical protein PKA88_11250 [Polyangiaceae bacterium]|nr:hypothetical protein [Polyangiaceae bacterium]
MTRRAGLTLVVAVAAALGGAWLLRSPSARLEATLRDTADQLSAAPGRGVPEREQAAATALAQWTTGATRVDLVGAHSLEQAALLSALRAWIRRRPQAVASLEGLSLRLDGDSATVAGELGISESQAGDLHRGRHRFQAKLRRLDGRWVLVHASLGDGLTEEPEARP